MAVQDPCNIGHEKRFPLCPSGVRGNYRRTGKDAETCRKPGTLAGETGAETVSFATRPPTGGDAVTCTGGPHRSSQDCDSNPSRHQRRSSRAACAPGRCDRKQLTGPSHSANIGGLTRRHLFNRFPGAASGKQRDMWRTSPPDGAEGCTRADRVSMYCSVPTGPDAARTYSLERAWMLRACRVQRASLRTDRMTRFRHRQGVLPIAAPGIAVKRVSATCVRQRQHFSVHSLGRAPNCRQNQSPENS